MNILSFDLELNQAESGAKIIEIGACVGDTSNGAILESYSAFVDPQEDLVPEIIQLTGIQQKDVNQGMTLLEAYQGMQDLAQKHDCQRMPLVWGGGDGSALRAELPPNTLWTFGRRELDVKAVFQSYQMAKGEKVQAGLAKALTKLDLNFVGKKHRAVDDAINTFYIYYALLQRWA